MTKECNPLVSLNAYAFSNGSGVGVNFPKGVIIRCGGLSISKDGIAAILARWDCSSALLARLFGLLDFLLMAVALPFMLLAYVIVIVVGVLCWTILSPIGCCSPTFFVFMKVVGIMALLAPLTIIVCPVLFVLSAFQIIVPELTCYVFQLHRWGQKE